MAISDLKNVLKIFQGTEPTAEEQKELFKEALLMTLARASAADTNLKDVEVETVQRVVGRELGSDVNAGDVKVAAASGLFETRPLDKYLARIRGKLAHEDRLSIMRCLSEVIHSDMRVSPFEVEFFNMVAKALNLPPADLVGLEADD